MKVKIKILILISLMSLSGFTRELRTFEKEIITQQTKLNLSTTKKRGIETESKEIYFVEKDNQTISAFKHGKLKWRTNVIEKFGKPKVGKLEIRFIEIRENKVFVVFGKHSFAEIKISSGKTKYIGAD